jgi:hypothetical protein
MFISIVIVITTIFDVAIINDNNLIENDCGANISCKQAKAGSQAILNVKQPQVKSIN